MKKIGSGFIVVALGIVSMTGCATTSRNYQADIDSLNARVTALQSQLSEKDQEIAKLNRELGDQQSELKRAESAKRDLSQRLSDAMLKLEAASKRPVVKPEESDLK